MQFLQSIFLLLSAPYERLECTEHLVLVRPNKLHFGQWSTIRQENMNFLQPFEPKWHEADLSKQGYKQRVRFYAKTAYERTGFSYFLIHKEFGLIGGISLFNIRYGCTSSGKVGYWLAKEHNGKGYMSAALACICKFGFYTLNLERIESACLEHNKRSIQLLKRNQFEEEGLAKAYLEINGKRQDHLLFARLKTQT
ncbi:MAG: GNAT family N-acetyltransferase [Nitratireductor sp.]